MRRLALLLILFSLATSACKKKNPNLDPPPAYEPKPATHHKFDGGASDPHSKGGDGKGGEGEASGGEGN